LQSLNLFIKWFEWVNILLVVIW